jgi:hypothetical protein
MDMQDVLKCYLEAPEILKDCTSIIFRVKQEELFSTV